MFNIGPPELLVILVLALVFVGPEQLPGIIRKSAKTFAEIKKVSTSLRTEFVETLEAETKDIKEAFSDTPLSFPDSGDPKAVSPTFSEEDKAIMAKADAAVLANEQNAEEAVKVPHVDEQTKTGQEKDEIEASSSVEPSEEVAEEKIDSGEEIVEPVIDTAELDQSP